MLKHIIHLIQAIMFTTDGFTIALFLQWLEKLKVGFDNGWTVVKFFGTL